MALGAWAEEFAYRLGRLPADEVENWLNDEVAGGLAPSSVHRHYRTLRRMLQVAVEKEKILSNPCEWVHPPRVPKREMVFLTWDEAIALVEAMHERYRPSSIWLSTQACVGASWSASVAPRSISGEARSA